MQKNKRRTSEEDNESVVQQLTQKYFPYWPLFLLSVVVGAGIAFIYLRYTTPVYEANATLIIKDQKKGNEDSKLMESLDLISANKIVENEIEIIQSRTLMINVVKALFLYAPVYEEGKINTISAYTKSPVFIQAPNPDSIQQIDRINFSYDKKRQTVALEGTGKYPINQVVNTPFGQLKFVPNKYYNELNDTASKQLYFSLIDPTDVAQALLDNLKVGASSKLSSVVELSYQDEVPKRAEDILNRLIAAYDESGINEKNKLALNTLSFVQDRLNIVAIDLDSIERKIQQYKSGKGAVDIGTQGQLFLQNVSVNDQKLSEVNMQLSVLDEVHKFVTDNENGGAIVPSTLGVGDPMLSQLLDKLYASELEYEKLRKTVGENHPTMVAVADQIKKIKPNILQNIESRKQSLMAAKQNLYATNGNYNSILQSVPQKERQLLDISREQSIKSNIYSFLLQKREESELAYSSAVSDHRVVDLAKTSAFPISPKKMIVILEAIAACMGLCFGVITIKESFTGKILYRHEVESRTSIPLI